MQENIREIQANISDFAKKIWEESRSSFQKTEKDVSGFVRRFVDNGKITQRDGEKIISKLSARFQKRIEEFERLVDDGSRWTLSKINVPSKGEIESLSRRIDKLSKRVNVLKNKMSA